jgi:hypothetical protein
MTNAALVELTKDTADVTINSAPKKGANVVFSFKATSMEVTVANLNDMLDMIIEDLNKGCKAEFGEPPAFRTQISRANLRLVNVAADADKKLKFQLAFSEVEFDYHQGHAQRTASNSILRTLNKTLPHALKRT